MSAPHATPNALADLPLGRSTYSVRRSVQLGSREGLASWIGRSLGVRAPQALQLLWAALGVFSLVRAFLPLPPVLLAVAAAPLALPLPRGWSL